MQMCLNQKYQNATGFCIASISEENSPLDRVFMVCYDLFMKDNSQKATRFHLFLFPNQQEYLRRFALVRKCSISQVVRDMIEDYISGRFFRDSKIESNYGY